VKERAQGGRQADQGRGCRQVAGWPRAERGGVRERRRKVRPLLQRGGRVCERRANEGPVGPCLRGRRRGGQGPFSKFERAAAESRSTFLFRQLMPGLDPPRRDERRRTSAASRDAGRKSTEHRRASTALVHSTGTGRRSVSQIHHESRPGTDERRASRRGGNEAADATPDSTLTDHGLPSTAVRIECGLSETAAPLS